MKPLISLTLLLLIGRLADASTLVGDWPFDRAADGVAITDGQPVLEENTAGLFDASGHWAMGQASHYAETAPPGPSAAAVYMTWKAKPGRGCALDTRCGGVYFLDGSPKLKAAADFSVWTRFEPLNADTNKTEIVLGRVGSWLICRKEGRLAAGVAAREASAGSAGIRDVFAGNGPLLETGKWQDIGFSIAGDSAAGNKLTVYLNGVLIKEAMGSSIPQGDAPFQIGGRGVDASFPNSQSLFNRVLFYDGVLGAKDFARLTRSGGPRLSPAAVVEPLMPSFWWNPGAIGDASGYQRLKWNPKLEAYCAGDDLYQQSQRQLFAPVLAPGRAYFGPASVASGGIGHYSIVSYIIPDNYDRHNRRVAGAVHLHSGKGEEAPGARLDLRIYVNDTLKLAQTISAQKEAATFATEVGKLAPGDRVYVAFGAAALGDKGELWCDYKVDLQPSGEPLPPASCPVAEAFRVDPAKPLEENAGWTAYHYVLCSKAKKNRVDLLFVGDSVTAGWDGNGKAVWDKQLMRYYPGNFGISGEGTQDVLWRISHGELDGLHPKAVVVLLGSNDINWPAADIAAGVKEVVRQIRARLPDSPLLLMGILPRGELPNTSERLKALEANAQLAKLDDGKHIHYFYFGDKLLLPDGRMPKEVAPDFLHPLECGYQFWMDAIQPSLDQSFPEQKRGGL